jgi:hypothetical protein
VETALLSSIPQKIDLAQTSWIRQSWLCLRLEAFVLLRIGIRNINSAWKMTVCSDSLCSRRELFSSLIGRTQGS